MTSLSKIGPLLVLLLAHCKVDLKVAESTQIACTTTAQCPAGYVCRESTGKCVDSNNLGDVTPPELAGEVSVAPAAAKVGATLLARFSVSEPLSLPPEVKAELRTGSVAWELDAGQSTDTTFVYKYVVQGDEPEGTAQLFVTLTDSAGNQAKGLLLGSFVLDFQPPLLISARPGAAAFKAGDLLVYTINVSEPLRVLPSESKGRPRIVVSRDGVAQPNFFGEPAIETNNSFAWTQNADGVADGSYSLAIVLEDEAGNVSDSAAGTGFQVDRTPPTVSALTVSPAQVRAGDTLTVTFDATEAVPSELLAVTAGNIALDCGDFQSASPHYSCTHTMTATDIPADTNTTETIFVNLVDVAGNRGAGSELITYDSRAPTVALAAVAYTLSADNPLSRATMATVGTTITVVAFPSEPIDINAPPTLTASHNSTVLTFVLDTATLTDTGATFTALIPPATPDGAYAPSLTWADLAGNTSAVTFASPLIMVKTSTPTLTIEQNLVSYIRSPWGNTSGECLCPQPAAGCTPQDDAQDCSGHYTPAGPYFALAPSDPLSSAQELAASAFTLGTSQPAMVRVFTNTNKANLLGRALPNPDNTWPRQQLASLDTAAIFVTGIDAAGNESSPVQVQTVEWVAAIGAGQSPHRLEQTAIARAAQFPDPTMTASATGAAGRGADGVFVSAGDRGVWRQRVKMNNVPGGRDCAPMAYDSARGRVVLFGGEGVNNTLEDLWEWDGTEWFGPFTSQVGPGARSCFGTAYDSARGRVVIFGGYELSGALSDELWEWDGASWFGPFKPTLRPIARDGFGFVYDSARQRTVLFGGEDDGGTALDDIWEWDGETQTWTGPIQPSTRPGPTKWTAMSYDSDRGRVVLFGGSTGIFSGFKNEVWEWDGDTQTWAGPIQPVTLPTARNVHAMTYDARLHRTVVFGGYGSGGARDDVWLWDGETQTWTGPLQPTVRPSRRRGAALAYDAMRGRTVFFGGLDVSVNKTTDTWEWDGTRWFGPLAGNRPNVLSGHSVTYDNARGRTVVFGGNGPSEKNDVWEWDGDVWFGPLAPATRPSARYGHGSAYDTLRNNVVVIGGGGNGYSDVGVWEWDGSQWLGPWFGGTSPTQRVNLTMAYDSARDRIVLFGGQATPGITEDDVWEWDRATQTWFGPYKPTLRPPPSYTAKMAYDAERQVSVLFVSGSASQGEVWEWNGTSQTWTGPLTPAPGPQNGWSATIAYNAESKRVMLFGDEDANMWEWDGAVWAGPFQTPTRPTTLNDHTMVHDSARGRMVLVGGPQQSNFLWEFDTSATRRPAVQLSAHFADAGFASNAIVGLTARAHCGGDFTPFDSGAHGSVLSAWSTGTQPPSLPGSWLEVASNNAPAALSTPDSGLMSFGLQDANAVRSYILDGSSTVSIRCEPDGGSGGGIATVSADYMEIRLRYQQ